MSNGILLPRFKGLSGHSKSNSNSKSVNHLRKLTTYIELINLGLSQSSLHKIDPYANNLVQRFAGEFQKTSVKSTALGWFKDSLRGELIANLAYNLYCRIAPHNKSVSKEPDPSDVLATYKAFVLMYPFYLQDEDGTRGLEINRLFGLLDAIREHKTATGKCGKCSTSYIRESTRRMSTCPHCALSSRIQKQASR